MWFCASSLSKNSTNLIALALFGAPLTSPAPLMFMWVPLSFWFGKKGFTFLAAACCSGPFLPDNISAK